MRDVINLNFHGYGSTYEYSRLYKFSDELNDLYDMGLDDEDIAHRLDIPVEEIFKVRTDPDNYKLRRFNVYFRHIQYTQIINRGFNFNSDAEFVEF